MIEEKVANNIEDIFTQLALGNFLPDHAREQLLKQLMGLTQKQREQCAEDARIVTLSHSSVSVVKKVQQAILNAEVKI